MRGLVIGKFYPPHAGHHFLIDTALSECEYLDVLVLAHPKESLSVADRVSILKDRHPNRTSVQGRETDLEVDYTSREIDKEWADLVWWMLYPHNVHDRTIYSSEEYGVRLAEDLTAINRHNEIDCTVDHRMVDPNRVALPVSATKIRHDPMGYWEYLSPAAKAVLTKRVVICGAESTGTSTLTKALAERYQTVQVPEFGRTYSEALGNHYKWSSDDFMEIIEEQERSEEYFARKAGPVMFCDTDGIATCLFHILYLRQGPPGEQVRRAYGYARQHHPLHIITDYTSVPFDDDGYRLFPQQREWATNWFQDQLADFNVVFVTGDPDERLAQASRAVDEILHWDFTPPIDEAVV